MRFSDYFRLSTAIISSHKKQACMILFIVGLPIMILVAFIFTIQGLENSIMSAALTPTGGKIFLSTSIDPDYCHDTCDIENNLAEIQQNISVNHGQIIDARLVVTNLGNFIQFPSFTPTAEQLPDSLPDNTIIISAPIKIAAKLIDFKLPEPNANPEEKLAAIETIKSQTLQKSITTDQGETYFLTSFLPTEFFAHNLSFSNFSQNNNPLDLLLANFRTTSSTHIIFGDIPDDIPSIDAAETGVIFAEFPDIKSASDYFYADTNYCTENDRILERCSDDYRYQVSQLAGSPINYYHNFQEIWSVLLFFIVLICIIETVVVISTYVRLIDKDSKTISLYHTMGARQTQIISIYIIYLLILSFLAVALAIIIGLIISTVISYLNAASLSQAFTLVFTVTSIPHLTAWNWSVATIAGLILSLAPFSVLLSLSRFTGKNLTKNLRI